MRDDASLQRLAEMGVDVYLPRGARRQGVAAAAALSEAAPVHAVAGVVDVVLFADASSPAARALAVDVIRSLKFARIACAAVGADADAETALKQVAAVIMFGEVQARRAGAMVPAQRQREIAWVVAGEPASLRGNALARRALWSELKRAARGLAQHGGPARG